MVTVRFNSQHPRKIIRGSGREEGVGSAHGTGAAGATPCPVTPIRPRALSLRGPRTLIQVPLAQTRGLVPRSPSARSFWENGFPSSDQPSHPSPELSCRGEQPQPKASTWGALPRSPFPAWLPSYPGSTLPWPWPGSSEMAEGTGVQGGLGVPTQLSGGLCFH